MLTVLKITNKLKGLLDFVSASAYSLDREFGACKSL